MLDLPVQSHWLQVVATAVIIGGFSGSVAATSSHPVTHADQTTAKTTPAQRKVRPGLDGRPASSASSRAPVQSAVESEKPATGPTFFLLNQAADDFSPPPAQPATPKPTTSTAEAPMAPPAEPAKLTSAPASTQPSRPSKTARAETVARQPNTRASASASITPQSHSPQPFVPSVSPTPPLESVALNRSAFVVDSAPDRTYRAPAQADNRVYTGFFQCEFGQRVLVDVDPQRPGQYKLTMGQQVMPMSPVPALEGLVRMEDDSRSLVWIQLAHKSMLLDHVQGQRVLDECTVPEQMAYAQMLARTPQRGLLD